MRETKPLRSTRTCSTAFGLSRMPLTYFVSDSFVPFLTVTFRRLAPLRQPLPEHDRRTIWPLPTRSTLSVLMRVRPLRSRSHVIALVADTLRNPLARPSQFSSMSLPRTSVAPGLTFGSLSLQSSPEGTPSPSTSIVLPPGGVFPPPPPGGAG